MDQQPLKKKEVVVCDESWISSHCHDESKASMGAGLRHVYLPGDAARSARCGNRSTQCSAACTVHRAVKLRRL
eukprot:1146984-Pelagomonas_calceolata.AAC.4